jgi:hypothetical protein
MKVEPNSNGIVDLEELMNKTSDNYHQAATIIKAMANSPID